MTGYLKSFLTRKALGQIIRVGLIGGFNTIVYFVVLNIMRWSVGFSSFWSVTVAFAVGTAFSYVMNRRWSFQIADGSVGNVRESASFFIVNVVAWATTAFVVQVAEGLWGPLGPIGLNAAAVVATGFVILPKFAAYRDVVFKRSLEQATA
ncbi:MAG: GtrA family protein [Acidimicrobiia bacterium]|nr:GtrA family protein [Acidimicrobiia bacterium]